jgi:hypothetical protein
MASAVLRSLLLLAGFVSGAGPQTPSRSQHVKLSASVGFDTKHNSMLRLSLRNNDSTPVTIVTGMRAGSEQYPAAYFSFTIIFRNGRQSKLWCATCEPAMIGGVVGRYTVILGPNQAWHFEIRVADFRVDGKSIGLCTSETEGAQIAVTLQGRQLNPSDTVLVSCS